MIDGTESLLDVLVLLLSCAQSSCLNLLRDRYIGDLLKTRQRYKDWEL